jgi:hypothetical protein
MQEAEELLLQCLECCIRLKRPLDPHSMTALVKILQERGDLSLAASLIAQLKNRKLSETAWEYLHVPKKQLPLPSTPEQARRNLMSSQGSGTSSPASPLLSASGLAASGKVTMRRVARKLDSVIESVRRKSPMQGGNTLRKSPSGRVSHIRKASDSAGVASEDVATVPESLTVTPMAESHASSDEADDSTEVKEFLQACERAATLSRIVDEVDAENGEEVPDYIAPARPESATIARNKALLERLRNANE